MACRYWEGGWAQACTQRGGVATRGENAALACTLHCSESQGPFQYFMGLLQKSIPSSTWTSILDAHPCRPDIWGILARAWNLKLLVTAYDFP